MRQAPQWPCRSASRASCTSPLTLALAASLALAAPCGAAASGEQPAALAVANTMTLATAASPLATLAIINCTDSGTGSLRDAIGSAADGATIDMTQLQCSTITLTSGSLAVPQNNLTIKGPGRSSLQIVPDAGQYVPVFAHAGSGLLTISGLRIANGANENSSASGGCITSSAGNVRVVAAEISHCESSQPVSSASFCGGGAIYAKGDVTIEDSLVTQNTAYGHTERVAGGGVFAAGNLFVRRSVIDGNRAVAQNLSSSSEGLGGGLAAKRSIEIVASTISNNVAGNGIGGASARGYGGGVFALDYYGGSTLVLTNSTVSNNYSGYLTGGVTSSAPTHISNSTIAFNSARRAYAHMVKVGVGLFVYSDAATLDSTIIANNTYSLGTKTYDLSLYKATVTGSHNLITKSDVSPPGTLTSDPKLVALADNGGPTPTHALGAFSPAIGTGSNPLNLASDQRGPGFSRVFSTFVDIGAFQTGDAIFANGLDPPS